MNIIATQHPAHESNYGGVNEGRKYVIVHANAGTLEGTLAWMQNPDANVSYHYLIALHGGVYQLVDEHERAWHAGRSQWENDSNLNDLSVGVAIESLEGSDSQVTALQYEALLTLIADIQARYDIPSKYVLGHKEVSPGRKTDPVHIDMDKLRNDLAERDADVIDTLVLHGFDGILSGATTVRGKMKVTWRDSKLDVRWLDE